MLRKRKNTVNKKRRIHSWTKITLKALWYAIRVFFWKNNQSKKSILFYHRWALSLSKTQNNNEYCNFVLYHDPKNRSCKHNAPNFQESWAATGLLFLVLQDGCLLDTRKTLWCQVPEWKFLFRISRNSQRFWIHRCKGKHYLQKKVMLSWWQFYI